MNPEEQKHKNKKKQKQVKQADKQTENKIHHIICTPRMNVLGTILGCINDMAVNFLF